MFPARKTSGRDPEYLEYPSDSPNGLHAGSMTGTDVALQTCLAKRRTRSIHPEKHWSALDG